MFSNGIKILFGVLIFLMFSSSAMSQDQAQDQVTARDAATEARLKTPFLMQDMVYVAEEFYKGVHVPIPSFSTLKFSGNLSLAPHRARLKISF